MPPTRDTEYYREDGDLVIQVEDTLFRIDKGFLKKEPSTFTDMFDMPRPSGHVDGEDDDHPLILSGDTVQEFKALCWSIYLSPWETPTLFKLTAPELNTAEISKFLSLALIAHKYEFTRLEAWASSFVKHFCLESNNGEQIFVDSSRRFTMCCSSDDLSRLLRYASISEETALLKAIRAVLLSRLDKDPPTLELADALNMGEEYAWEELQTDIYYRIVCHLSEMGFQLEDWSSEFLLHDCPSDPFPPGLTDDQKSRARRGYSSLSVMSDWARRTLFKNLYSSTVTYFPSRYLQRATIDIINQLQDIQHSSYLPSGLDSSGIQEMLTKVKTDLPKCFFDSVDPTPPKPYSK